MRFTTAPDQTPPADPGLIPLTVTGSTRSTRWKAGSESLAILPSRRAASEPGEVTTGATVGTSYTDYDGRGFWAPDAVVELWLYELVAAINASSDPPAWLRKARDRWSIQATVGFMGCVSVGMDEHLAGDPDRESLFLELVRRADEHIASYGPAIPANVANSFGTGGPGVVFVADVDTRLLHAFTIAVADLVRGHPTGDVY